jgi:glycosyltransferase involved in cell wall biosynthesis
VGGVSDLIDHEHNGLLFPTGDETALTQYLCELLANPTRARVIATAGRREVLERYDAARMAADYDRHYRQLLAVKRGAFSRSRLRRGVTWATPVA